MSQQQRRKTGAPEMVPSTAAFSNVMDEAIGRARRALEVQWELQQCDWTLKDLRDFICELSWVFVETELAQVYRGTATKA